MGIISKEFRLPKVGAKKKRWYVTFKCDKCGSVCTYLYNKHTFNSLCILCKKGRRTTEEFIQAAREVHKDTYDYTKSNYVNKRTPIVITCKIHGDFSQRPAEHLEGYGCKRCSFLRASEMYTYPTTLWHSRLAERHSHIKLISDASGYHSLATFRCDIHGEFTSRLGAITQNKYLCPECARYATQLATSRTGLYTPTILYYVYLPTFKLYKLGITVRDLTSRFGKTPFQLIWVVSGYHHVIARAEYDLHNVFSSIRYTGPDVLRNGNTELYTTNIIPTLESFYELTNKLNIQGFQGSNALSKIT